MAGGTLHLFEAGAVVESPGEERGPHRVRREAAVQADLLDGRKTFPTFLGEKGGSTVESMLDHIEYAAKLIGPERIGIGTDVAGIRHYPEPVMEKMFREDLPAHGWRDQDVIKAWTEFKARWEKLEQVNMEYGKIIRGLIARGYSDDEIEGIMGGNFLRFFETVVG